MSEKLNTFTIAQQQLDQAAQIMGLAPATHELLRLPMREMQFTMPVRMDDGAVRIFRGFRVQYNSARGRRKVASDSTPTRRSTRYAHSLPG